ncbi:MAG TPA: hypothetical protein VJQ43_01720, partial [Thermoplasmata archaeon]|nr:hypothetical protein [Thermoplasmata archaeon]
IPPRPDVALQLRYFQLAFPQFHTVLICFDRHRAPIEWTSTTIPPPTDAEAAEALRLGHDLGLAYGQEKVLEYLDGQAVSYALPPPSTGG